MRGCSLSMKYKIDRSPHAPGLERDGRKYKQGTFEVTKHARGVPIQRATDELSRCPTSDLDCK